MARYKKGDIVLLPFPFLTTRDIKRKLRPALVVSDHTIPKRYNDLILLAITSKISKPLFETEILVDSSLPTFVQTGLTVDSVIKCDMILTLPEDIVVRKIGELDIDLLRKVQDAILKGVGIKLVNY
jgi:mRNA interferase MazF